MIKTKIYNDPRSIGIPWVCRCHFCKELFTGFKADFICNECQDKPEVKNENEDNTKIVNEELGKA